jgi:hypothetical protein
MKITKLNSYMSWFCCILREKTMSTFNFGDHAKTKASYTLGWGYCIFKEIIMTHFALANQYALKHIFRVNSVRTVAKILLRIRRNRR